MDIIKNLPKELQMMVYEYHHPYKKQFDKCINDFKDIKDFYGDEWDNQKKFVIWRGYLEDRFRRIHKLLGYREAYLPKDIPLYRCEQYEYFFRHSWKLEHYYANYDVALYLLISCNGTYETDENGLIMDSDSDSDTDDDLIIDPSSDEEN